MATYYFNVHDGSAFTDKQELAMKQYQQEEQSKEMMFLMVLNLGDYLGTVQQ